ncbi:DUF7004 family protein [Butyrivibrio sp. AD3002]|uniref:DUF7004 family protein n=1 Tax=Butyrivibrio sp. AD3002 TaxID=1280670 RepID=UPI0003B6131D|nr:hypothetical protein [Butyrivibrio sp. AD3002]
MGRLVKEFSDGAFLEFDRGGFDNWCVYMTNSEGVRKPPFDRDYFAELKDLANKYGADKVYADFVSIFDVTTRNIEASVLEQITNIAQSYEAIDTLAVDKLYTTFYMAMTAEENYPNTKLGRRIKRLAAYEILYNNRPVADAVVFMKKMPWREIDALCRERGF